MTRCRWVDSRKAEGFPVTMACTVAGVSTTTFYDWLTAARCGPSPRELDEAYLVNEIHDAHRGSDGAYGAPRITPVLRRAGAPVNHKRVERLMRVHGIAGVFKPAKVRTTIPDEENPPIPDLIGRGFAPGRPNVAWCGDIKCRRRHLKSYADLRTMPMSSGIRLSSALIVVDRSA